MYDCYAVIFLSPKRRLQAIFFDEKRDNMTARKHLIAIPALIALGVPFLMGAARADTTLTFENIPQDYYSDAGNQNLGSYYQGVTFGPGVTILDSVGGGLNSTAFPPHSGNAVATTASDPDFTFSFAAPQSGVSFWYTSVFGGTATATLHGGGTEVLSLTGNTGSTSQAAFASKNIDSVTITSLYNAATYDDIHFNGSFTAVPEPSSTAALAMGMLGMIGLAAGRRRNRRSA